MANNPRLLGWLAASLLWPGAAGMAAEGNWLNVTFPRDSPVVSTGFNFGPTTVTMRGASMVVDLHASLSLRNVSKKPLSGLTLRVEAQDLSPYGKGSVIKPSLFVMPGEDFPVKVEMELTRSVAAAKSELAMVQVTLDCALFNDLSAYGPDKLKSSRTLMVYELQARRDRLYLAKLLESERIPELREELNFGILDYVRQMGFELFRGPASVVRPREQSLTVRPVAFPKGPVQPLSGGAHVAGNEVRAPRVEVLNRSKLQVASVAMGWIVRDDKGKDFVAGALTSHSQPIAPVQTMSISEQGTLRFSRPTGEPMVIESLMAFVNDVQFADGTLWIPSRADIEAATSDATLRRELATSPEEQRLATIYRRDGTDGLRKELKRLNLLN